MVFIRNCDQMLMKPKKNEPLYSTVEKSRRTAEHLLYVNNKLLSVNLNNNEPLSAEATKNGKIN
jgi:hypothetical protein